MIHRWLFFRRAKRLTPVVYSDKAEKRWYVKLCDGNNDTVAIVPGAFSDRHRAVNRARSFHGIAYYAGRPVIEA